MRKPKFLIFFLVILFYAGCATAPSRQGLPSYSLNGTSYFPLVSLCDIRGIQWEYDTFSRTIELSKDAHRVQLRVGDTLALVDGAPKYLRYPVDLHQGTVVAPFRFKEQVLDILFREKKVYTEPVCLITPIRKVVIDPGHGGKDPGAIGRTGLREKDVNLDIAKRLGQLFKKDGIEVVYTRTTDKFITLPARVDIANSSKADLFLSIHSNANRVRSLKGFEVYYVSPTVNDAQRALSAAKVGRLDFDRNCALRPSLDLKATIWDMVLTHNRAEAISLAGSICKSINHNLDVEVLGVKGARFYVLKGTRMPAILIEVGFVSNASEERFLKNYYYREKLAESIREGVLNYGRELALTKAKQ